MFCSTLGHHVNLRQLGRVTNGKFFEQEVRLPLAVFLPQSNHSSIKHKFYDKQSYWNASLINYKDANMLSD